MLEQVLRNFYENAVKYAPAGGTVRTTATRGESSVTIRVDEKGSGSRRSTWARVRAVPAAGAPATDRARDGVRTLSEPTAGRGAGRTIAAASAGPGRAATFTVDLPVAQGWREDDEDDIESGRRRLKKQMVLVVDDESAIVRLVRTKLQADGYAVITAERGEKALELWRTSGLT